VESEEGKSFSAFHTLRDGEQTMMGSVAGNPRFSGFIKMEDNWIEVPPEYKGQISGNIEVQLQSLNYTKNIKEQRLKEKIFRQRRKNLFK
jgi:hypothetical protein